MSDQWEENYQFFIRCLPDILESHRGAHVLLHDRSIDGYFATSLDAIKAGLTKHGENNFSVELVDDAVEDLGFFSHVSSTLRA